MNGKHVDPAYELEYGQIHGVMPSAGQKAARKQRLVRDVIHLAIIAAVLALFSLAMNSPAEARQRFRAVQASSCSGPSCAIKQQAVVVHHAQPVVQKVVAAPVVHHAAPVVAYPPTTQIHNQNNWYSVGQPLVQQSQLVAAAREALAEQQLKATFQGSFQGSVQGSAQQLYQQQQSPVYSPPPQPQQPAPSQPWQPPAEPQPPQEPELPTFSQTVPNPMLSMKGHMTAPAFDQHCAACHSNGKSKSGFAIGTMDTAALVLAAERVRDGTMPPNSKLTQAEKDAIIGELSAIHFTPPPAFP